MKKSSDDLQKLDFINNNHSIIYAPNSTGKTRLTNKLSTKYRNEPAMFLTAGKIDEMLAFNGRKIFVGADSQPKVENENIIKEYNKNKIIDEVLKIYEAKTAAELVKKSSLFNKVGLKRKDCFEFYSKLKKYSPAVEVHSKAELSYEDLVLVDKELSKIDLDEMKRITKDNISLLLETNSKTISKELENSLKQIKDSIEHNQMFCPLCGHVFDSNKELRAAIEKTLAGFTISSDVKDRELCIAFINTLSVINKKIGFEVFFIEYKNEIKMEFIINNLSMVDALLSSLSQKIIGQIDSVISPEKFKRYSNNLKIIEKEDSERKNNKVFLDNVKKVLSELITLPYGYSFINNQEAVFVEDDDGKMVDPKNFLSESEQKRMCISIVYAEIKQRNLQYVIFDDPVDSNDDYYFDISVNVIGDLILNNSVVNWMVLTHEFRLVSILAERCITSDNSFQKSIKFLFYLPDPSIRNGGIPPYDLHTLTPYQLGFLNEHETIIFKKIFVGVPGYQCDKDLALLSSFNTARNLYNDILSCHRIKRHERKKLIDCISIGNKSYEHYKNGTKGIMRMSTLFRMNNLMYDSCSPTYLTKSKSYAAKYRSKYVKTTAYSSIVCENPVLKYILFAMIRVMNLHYWFEKKLADWANANLSGSFSYSSFKSTLMLGNKINYVKGICTIPLESQLKKFLDCFEKWRGLLNDFAHSASRIIPPYLTINPIEMDKLESQINKLP